MNFSLITVYKEENGLVDGVWLQHCMGVTLEEAKIRAKETEAVNSNRINVAVVDQLNFTEPNYSMVRHLKRLG